MKLYLEERHSDGERGGVGGHGGKVVQQEEGERPPREDDHQRVATLGVRAEQAGRAEPETDCIDCHFD